MSSGRGECSCCGRGATPSVQQTLEEMEFERGIWSAALCGELERVRCFLGRGADPDVPDRASYTALHYAGRAGHRGVCELLLDAGARVNAQTRGGATPLHRAAYCGRLAVVELLLERGAEPALTDDDGSTPLHKAAEQRHRGVCELLIRCRPSLRDVKDRRCRVAWDLLPEEEAAWDFLKPPEGQTLS